MASEILAIKEQYLEEFVGILKRGIMEEETSGFPLSPALKNHLMIWIGEVEKYLERIGEL